MKESAKAPQKKHAYRRNQNGNFFMHLLIFSLASQLALVNCERMVFADFAVTGGTVLPANGYRYYLYGRPMDRSWRDVFNVSVHLSEIDKTSYRY